MLTTLPDLSITAIVSPRGAMIRRSQAAHRVKGNAVGAAPVDIDLALAAFKSRQTISKGSS